MKYFIIWQTLVESNKTLQAGLVRLGICPRKGQLVPNAGKPIQTNYTNIVLDVVVSYYSDKLTHVQVIINCPYSIAQMCTRKETLAHSLGEPCLDDIMSYNSLTTIV